MDTLRQIHCIKIDYLRANRCWRSNNLKTCLLLCDRLGKRVTQFQLTQRGAAEPTQIVELERLKNLIWHLKIRCLSDDYYLNESLLLNDEDIDDEDNQVRLINQKGSAANQSATALSRPLTGRPVTAGHKLTATGRIETRQRTAILTGKRSSLSSRQSSQGASSYRPLTTSLTATQTAFSRSTRPLLKYVACDLLSKDLFEYLYNVQTITNKCPDYRQCLEYLNLVRKSACKKVQPSRPPQARASASGYDGENVLLDLSGVADDEKLSLGCFWLKSFGICYFNLRMNKEALEYFSYARDICPKSLDAYTWLIKVYLRTNQPKQVLKTCQLGLQHCKSSILYNWMARVQSLVNDLYKANLSLSESLHYHPTNIEALANVGHFAFYADKPELSLECFERIQQLSINQSASLDSDYQTIACFSQLLNNLALSNFFCGHYQKVVPLFFRALLSSPNKEITSDIWYNLSFVPVSCGFSNLAMACLKLALRNDSQNLEALNNLGVLKCRSLVGDDDDLHFANIQEHWGARSQKFVPTQASGSRPIDGRSQERIPFNEIQTFFKPPPLAANQQTTVSQPDFQPEMLFNMAVIEKKRGRLLTSMNYCQLYTQHDKNNYHIQNMMREIRQLVSHNG